MDHTDTEQMQTHVLPEALYGCAFEECAEEQPYPPEMLRWWAGSQRYPAGWYCTEICIDECKSDVPDNDDDTPGDVEGKLGPLLSAEITRRLCVLLDAVQ